MTGGKENLEEKMKRPYAPSAKDHCSCAPSLDLTLTLCGPAFFHQRVPTRWARLALYGCVVGKPFEKNGLESPLIFVFILKGKTK